MDIKEIEKLMKAMSRNQIGRIAYKEGSFEIELEKEDLHQVSLPSMPMLSPSVPVLPHTPETPEVPPSAPAPAAESEGTYITSPMVGTFYESPSPDDPPFVKVGSEVKKDDAVCIIEAMKVMNEVKSGEIAGKIVEVLVKNGEPVEYGTKLFKVV